MNKSNSTEDKMIAIMQSNNYGIPISDLCREHGIDRSNYYRWRTNFELQQHIKKLEIENQRLRKMYANEWLRSRGP